MILNLGYSVYLETQGFDEVVTFGQLLSGFTKNNLSVNPKVLTSPWMREFQNTGLDWSIYKESLILPDNRQLTFIELDLTQGLDSFLGKDFNEKAFLILTQIYLSYKANSIGLNVNQNNIKPFFHKIDINFFKEESFSLQYKDLVSDILSLFGSGPYFFIKKSQGAISRLVLGFISEPEFNSEAQETKNKTQLFFLDNFFEPSDFSFLKVYHVSCPLFGFRKNEEWSIIKNQMTVADGDFLLFQIEKWILELTHVGILVLPLITPPLQTLKSLSTENGGWEIDPFCTHEQLNDYLFFSFFSFSKDLKEEKLITQRSSLPSYFDKTLWFCKTQKQPGLCYRSFRF